MAFVQKKCKIANEDNVYGRTKHKLYVMCRKHDIHLFLVLGVSCVLESSDIITNSSLIQNCRKAKHDE